MSKCRANCVVLLVLAAIATFLFRVYIFPRTPMSTSYRLYHAICAGRETEVRDLIRNGADVNELSFLGSTPIVAAVDYENAPIIKALLAAGARPDDGFWISVARNRLSSTKLLIDSGAKVNMRFEYGKTALTRSRELGFRDMEELIKAHGGRE